ncbi:MAG: VOC family protein [Polyangiaceae bacterium]
MDLVAGVHHLAVVVSDLAQSERFYAGVLGLAVTRRWDDAAGAPRAVWLDLGRGAFLALEHATAGEPLRADGAPGWHCVALGIERDAREAWRKRLAAAGHPVERETAFTLYARDPDGQLLGLSHWPDEAEPRATG